MIESYRKMLALLDARERWRFVLLMGILAAAATADLIAVSSVMGLLNVLAEPTRLPDLFVLGRIQALHGAEGPFAAQIALTLAVILVIATSLAMRAFATYAIIRYSEMRGYAISCRLFAAYLHRPYSWFLNRNSAEIGKTVLSEAEELVGRVLIPALQIVSNILVVLVILCFLLLVDPVIAPVAGGLIGGGYALIYLRLRPLLQQLGHSMLVANSERFRMAQEATGGVKEVKLMGLEDSYVRRFELPARRRAQASALNQALAQLPRFALEALTFAVLMSLVLVLLIRNDGDLAGIVPILGTIAFATLRLLPALQQIYHAFANLRGGRAVLDHIHEDYTTARAARSDSPTASAAPLPLNRELRLETVHYSYPSATRTALRGVSLTIPACTTVGIVGGTGAGKTTLVDLILGLLDPQSGTIRVDETLLSATTRPAWQRTVGYVPQAIYLVDDTIAANIAFGIPHEKIDMGAVERAGRIAALHQFVTDDLPDGYSTVVGERGVRLSGGQRQRIGIARALYRDPTLLVMDEATSALDNLTERVVMEAVANMRGARTIILIAHRLSTVRGCDTIHLMESGQVVASGTYVDLVAGNDTFRRMAAGD